MIELADCKHTGLFQMLSKPEQAHNDNADIDEADVCEHRDEVEHQLLIRVQLFHIDA